MRRPISPTSDRRAARAGFTLIELSLAMLILGLIAAIVLPRVMPGTSSSMIRFSTWQVAAIMRADRNAAIDLNRPIKTLIDLEDHKITSGATGKSISLQPDLALRLDTTTPGGVLFSPNGRASEALFVLARGKAGFGIRVNRFTSTVEIVVVKP